MQLESAVDGSFLRSLLFLCGLRAQAHALALAPTRRQQPISVMQRLPRSTTDHNLVFTQVVIAQGPPVCRPTTRTPPASTSPTAAGLSRAMWRIAAPDRERCNPTRRRGVRDNQIARATSPASRRS